ncbi:hypothetical protein [Methylomonas rivi]|uniref:RiboL-PSP-HEPN domain-containing protein n=1 Tax=Methylomonas rivi TaxID=2952226 RepID=A0ABT1U523_9GAMM|nr:hypothetical protein [Methylomonas sp. WSC-6]MCQ8128890.1 hypothetical protein [Methylomonas sp. WSC-6]
MISVDCLKVERALLSSLSVDELNSKERDLYKEKKPSFEIGRLVHRMAQGYYSHTAAVEVARDPRSKALASTILQGVDGQPVPVGYVVRNNKTQHTYDFNYYLDYLNNPTMVDDLARSWLVGSLLTIGDALSKLRYLDHAPELELLYHLRNGIAHGNKFNLTKDGLARLKKYPAHNKKARVKSAEFEIVENLKGKPVLFDFMGPGDILDLLQSIEVHLTWICPR